MAGAEAGKGLGNQGEFWNQVCAQYKTGNDVLADPFTAISAIPAATSSMRDMSDVRFTGASVCAGQMHRLQQVLGAVPRLGDPGRGQHGRRSTGSGDQDRFHAAKPTVAFTQMIKHLGMESRKIMQEWHL